MLSGLGAAAALAIEFDAVSWGVGGWRDDPQRIGSYRLTVPASAVRNGRNRLAFVPADRDGREARIRFWYVRLWRAAPTA